LATPPSVLYDHSYRVTYDIVYEKYLSSKIIVVVDGAHDDVEVSFSRNSVYVRIYSDEESSPACIRIQLKRSIKSLSYKVKNGILTISVKHHILPFS